MAFSKEMTCVGCALLLLVLLVFLFSAPDYQPYYKNIPYAKYEGFEAFSVEGLDVPGEYSEVSGNVNSSSSSVESFATLQPAFLSGEGGLFAEGVNNVFTQQPANQAVYGGSVGSSEHLDHFLDVRTTGVDGKDGCQSAGLSNSRGALCLTPDLIDQLRTRGGNASGL